MQRELPVQVSGPENNRGGWIIAGVLFAGVLVALAVVVFLAGRVGDTAPPEVPEFRQPANLVLPRFEVRSVDGGKAVLVADGTKGQSVDVTRELDLGSARIEVLRTTAVVPEVGQGVTVVGVWDQVHNLSIRSIVVHGTAPADGAPVSPGGFRGHEAETDGMERPALEGRVSAAEGRELTISGGGRDVTLMLAESGAPVYELVAGTAEDVVPGARVSLREADGAVAVLVLPPVAAP